MPKQGYRVIIFYDDNGDLANVEIMPTQEAKHLVLGFKVGAEKRNFKVYRLGALLERCSRESESGLTMHAQGRRESDRQNDVTHPEAPTASGDQSTEARRR